MMSRAEIEQRIAASPGGLPVWLVEEIDRFAPPFVTPSFTLLAAFLDWPAAEQWRDEVHARRPGFDHELRACRLVSIDAVVPLGGRTPLVMRDVVRALEDGPGHPRIDPATLALRTAWKSERWPSAADESCVWLDALEDELVWWGARHEKGDHEFTTREPVTTFLERKWLPREAPPALAGEILRAIATHRLAGAEQDPCLAARRGALPRLQLLLSTGASIEHRDRMGRTPLAAAWTCAIETVPIFLLEAGASLEEAMVYAFGESARGRSLAVALADALRRRRLALAEALIARGAPVDEPMPARAWELALACGAPRSLLDEMIARGARLDPTSGVWTSQRFITFAWRDPKLAVLSPVPIPPPPVAATASRAPPRAAPRASREEDARKERARVLAKAIAAGNTAAVDAALASGTAPDHADWDGQLALHHVSLAPPEQQAALVERLRAAGAVVDARARSGATALTKAVRRGALPAARSLLAAGARANETDDGAPLTVHAVLADAPEILELLLSAGASPSARDAHGKTALDLARAKGRAACAAILARRG